MVCVKVSKICLNNYLNHIQAITHKLNVVENDLGKYLSRLTICTNRPTTFEAKTKIVSSVDKIPGQIFFAMPFVRICNFIIALSGCLGFYFV